MTERGQVRIALLRSEGILCQECDQLLDDKERENGFCARCWEDELAKILEIASHDDPEPQQVYDSSGWRFYPELEPGKPAYSLDEVYERE